MATTRWNIDTTHSHVQFSVRHMVMSKVRGGFSRWNASLEMDGEDLTTAKATAHIEIASIDTREAQRDAHLRSADFFDAERFPAMTFTSKRFESAGKDRFRVVGDLTIRDVTREVVLDAEYLGKGKDPWGNERVGFSASTSVDRKEFGLTWNQLLETGGVLVGEKVEIELELQAVKEQASAAA